MAAAAASAIAAAAGTGAEAAAAVVAPALAPCPPSMRWAAVGPPLRPPFFGRHANSSFYFKGREAVEARAPSAAPAVSAACWSSSTSSPGGSHPLLSFGSRRSIVSSLRLRHHRHPRRRRRWHLHECATKLQEEVATHRQSPQYRERQRNKEWNAANKIDHEASIISTFAENIAQSVASVGTADNKLKLQEDAWRQAVYEKKNKEQTKGAACSDALRQAMRDNDVCTSNYWSGTAPGPSARMMADPLNHDVILSSLFIVCENAPLLTKKNVLGL